MFELVKNHSHTSYDNYDYSEFWEGREYEDRADKIAVSRLLSCIKGSYDSLIDIGAGRGRITVLYEKQWEKFVLLDPSQRQLNEAKENISSKNKATFLVGNAEAIPVPDESFDTAICVRTFHYILDPASEIKEISRILKKNGYLILEIPNKIHIKNRLKAIFKKRDGHIYSNHPINLSTENAIFVNHNPKTILGFLKDNNFQIIEMLSVSNFRSSTLKKIIPVSILIFAEKLLQKPLAKLWFGPSIYFLAIKSK